ncbi:phage tail tube protein [Clostridioides difficile]
MSDFIASRVMSGSKGELWLNNEFVGEVKAFQAKAEKNKEEVPIAGQPVIDTKTISITCKGSMTLYKSTSRMLILMSSDMQKGIDTRCTFITKLDDPDAWGAEKIAIENVSFDDLTLADWEVNKLGEVECPFTFTGWRPVDIVEYN